MKTLSASRTSVTSSGLGTECCAAEGPSACHNDMERVSCDWWSDGHVTSTRPLIGQVDTQQQASYNTFPSPGSHQHHEAAISSSQSTLLRDFFTSIQRYRYRDMVICN